MKIFLVLILIGWWLVITITLPFWILIFSVGIPFGWTTWKDVLNLIWNGFYKCEIMGDY